MRIDVSSPIPRYFQLKQHVLAMLQEAGVAPGSRLPSETELAAQAGVSRFTVRQALEELKREGWLEKHRGRGTFAVKPVVPLSVAWRLVGFFEDMSRKGYRVSSRVLEDRLTVPSVEIRKALGLGPKGLVVTIQRLRSVNGRAFLIDNVHVRSDLCPGLEAIDLTDGSLYRVLEDRYRLRIARAHRTLTIATADSRTARLLGVPRGSPLYRLTDLLFTARGEPLQYAQTLIVEDRCEFVFDLARHPAERGKGSISVNQSTYPDLKEQRPRRGGPARARRRSA